MNYKVLSEVSCRNVGDEVFLLNRNDSSVYNLNATAAHVFKEIQAGKAVEDVVSEVCANFDVDLDTAHQDVLDLIQKLLDKKMIARVEQ